MVQFEILDNRVQKNMKVGYARVSSNTQDLELQTQELLKAGCDKVYSESISGKDNNRPELMAMIERCAPWKAVGRGA